MVVLGGIGLQECPMKHMEYPCGNTVGMVGRGFLIPFSLRWGVVLKFSSGKMCSVGRSKGRFSDDSHCSEQRCLGGGLQALAKWDYSSGSYFYQTCSWLGIGELIVYLWYLVFPQNWSECGRLDAVGSSSYKSSQTKALLPTLGKAFRRQKLLLE